MEAPEIEVLKKENLRPRGLSFADVVIYDKLAQTPIPHREDFLNMFLDEEIKTVFDIFGSRFSLEVQDSYMERLCEHLIYYKLVILAGEKKSAVQGAQREIIINILSEVLPNQGEEQGEEFLRVYLGQEDVAKPESKSYRKALDGLIDVDSPLPECPIGNSYLTGMVYRVAERFSGVADTIFMRYIVSGEAGSLATLLMRMGIRGDLDNEVIQKLAREGLRTKGWVRMLRNSSDDLRIERKVRDHYYLLRESATENFPEADIDEFVFSYFGFEAAPIESPAPSPPSPSPKLPADPSGGGPEGPPATEEETSHWIIEEIADLRGNKKSVPLSMGLREGGVPRFIDLYARDKLGEAEETERRDFARGESKALNEILNSLGIDGELKGNEIWPFILLKIRIHRYGNQEVTASQVTQQYDACLTALNNVVQVTGDNAERFMRIYMGLEEAATEEAEADLSQQVSEQFTSVLDDLEKSGREALPSNPQGLPYNECFRSSGFEGVISIDADTQALSELLREYSVTDSEWLGAFGGTFVAIKGAMYNCAANNAGNREQILRYYTTTRNGIAGRIENARALSGLEVSTYKAADKVMFAMLGIPGRQVVPEMGTGPSAPSPPPSPPEPAGSETELHVEAKEVDSGWLVTEIVNKKSEERPVCFGIRWDRMAEYLSLEFLKNRESVEKLGMFRQFEFNAVLHILEDEFDISQLQNGSYTDLPQRLIELKRRIYEYSRNSGDASCTEKEIQRQYDFCIEFLMKEVSMSSTHADRFMKIYMGVEKVSSEKRIPLEYDDFLFNLGYQEYVRLPRGPLGLGWEESANEDVENIDLDSDMAVIEDVWRECQIEHSSIRVLKEREGGTRDIARLYVELKGSIYRYANDRTKEDYRASRQTYRACRNAIADRIKGTYKVKGSGLNGYEIADRFMFFMLDIPEMQGAEKSGSSASTPSPSPPPESPPKASVETREGPEAAAMPEDCEAVLDRLADASETLPREPRGVAYEESSRIEIPQGFNQEALYAQKSFNYEVLEVGRVATELQEDDFVVNEESSEFQEEMAILTSNLVLLKRYAYGIRHGVSVHSNIIPKLGSNAVRALNGLFPGLDTAEFFGIYFGYEQVEQAEAAETSNRAKELIDALGQAFTNIGADTIRSNFDILQEAASYHLGRLTIGDSKYDILLTKPEQTKAIAGIPEGSLFFNVTTTGETGGTVASVLAVSPDGQIYSSLTGRIENSTSDNARVFNLFVRDVEAGVRENRDLQALARWTQRIEWQLPQETSVSKSPAPPAPPPPPDPSSPLGSPESGERAGTLEIPEMVSDLIDALEEAGADFDRDEIGRAFNTDATGATMDVNINSSEYTLIIRRFNLDEISRIADDSGDVFYFAVRGEDDMSAYMVSGDGQVYSYTSSEIDTHESRNSRVYRRLESDLQSDSEAEDSPFRSLYEWTQRLQWGDVPSEPESSGPDNLTEKIAEEPEVIREFLEALSYTETLESAVRSFFDTGNSGIKGRYYRRFTYRDHGYSLAFSRVREGEEGILHLSIMDLNEDGRNTAIFNIDEDWQVDEGLSMDDRQVLREFQEMLSQEIDESATFTSETAECLNAWIGKLLDANPAEEDESPSPPTPTGDTGGDQPPGGSAPAEPTPEEPRGEVVEETEAHEGSDLESRIAERPEAEQGMLRALAQTESFAGLVGELLESIESDRAQLKSFEFTSGDENYSLGIQYESRVNRGTSLRLSINHLNTGGRRDRSFFGVIQRGLWTRDFGNEQIANLRDFQSFLRSRLEQEDNDASFSNDTARELTIWIEEILMANPEEGGEPPAPQTPSHEPTGGPTEGGSAEESPPPVEVTEAEATELPDAVNELLEIFTTDERDVRDQFTQLTEVDPTSVERENLLELVTLDDMTLRAGRVEGNRAFLEIEANGNTYAIVAGGDIVEFPLGNTVQTRGMFGRFISVVTTIADGHGQSDVLVQENAQALQGWIDKLVWIEALEAGDKLLTEEYTGEIPDHVRDFLEIIASGRIEESQVRLRRGDRIDISYGYITTGVYGRTYLAVSLQAFQNGNEVAFRVTYRAEIRNQEDQYSKVEKNHRCVVDIYADQGRAIYLPYSFEGIWSIWSSESDWVYFSRGIKQGAERYLRCPTETARSLHEWLGECISSHFILGLLQRIRNLYVYKDQQVDPEVDEVDWDEAVRVSKSFNVFIARTNFYDIRLRIRDRANDQNLYLIVRQDRTVELDPLFEGQNLAEARAAVDRLVHQVRESGSISERKASVDEVVSWFEGLEWNIPDAETESSIHPVVADLLHRLNQFDSIRGNLGVDVIDESILEVNETIEMTDFLRMTRREDDSVIITFVFTGGNPQSIRITSEGEILNREGKGISELNKYIKYIISELHIFYNKKKVSRELTDSIEDWIRAQIGSLPK